MNFKPRLDKDIPKKYLYIKMRNENYHNDRLLELKEKRDNESKKNKKILQEQKQHLIETYTYIKKSEQESREISLYNNKFTVYDFTKDRVDFNNGYVIKIKPICMFETRNHSGTKSYDLYSFKVDKIIHDEETLMNCLKKDCIVDRYILNKFLNLCYSNEEYTKPREDFIEFVKSNYLDHRPSFSTIVDWFKNYDYESCTTYKADEHKTSYYEDAYKNGFIRLYEKYGTEATMMMLLRQRMFDVLDDWITECDESILMVVKSFSEEPCSNYETIKEIKKMLLQHLDNPVCKKIYDFIGFKNSGYVLKVFGYDQWEERYQKEKFESKTIEEIKKHIVKNYECDFNKVAEGKINEMWVTDNSGNEYELELEFIE